MSELDDALDALLGAPEKKGIDQHIIGEGDTAIDPDTFEIIENGERKKLRLGGVGGPELMQIDDKGTIKREELTGSETHRVVSQLIDEGNYTMPVFSGKQDAFGRELGDRINPETGESLRAKGLETGILQTTRYSSQQQADLAYLAEAERKIKFGEGKLDKWDAAGILLNAERQNKPFEPKPMAATPWEYAQNPGMYRGTEIVPGDRYFDNTAKGWLGLSGELGGEAVLSGLYGTMDMFSHALGNESGYGEAGNRALEWEQRFGPSTDFMDPFDAQGNWKLDSFGDYAKFIIGTGMTSLPQMGVTFGAMLAVPITGGASLAIPGLMYAGQTWDEMEDPNAGDIPTALLAGAAQGALDILGVGSIGMGKRLFSNPSVKKKILGEIMGKNPGITSDMAETILTKSVKRQLAAMSETYRDQLKKALTVRSLAGAYGIKVGTGMAGEAVTEAAQETIATIAAHGVENIDPEQFQRRIITAAIGGGFLGGAFSSVGFAGEAGYTYDALKSYETVQKEKLAAQQYKERDKEWQRANGEAGLTARDKKTAIQDTVEEAKSAGFNPETIDVDEEAQIQQNEEQKKGWIRKLRDYYKHRSIIPGSTQGPIDTLRGAFKGRGRILDTIFESWGNGRGHDGPNNEQYFQQKKGEYTSMVNNSVQDEAKWEATEVEISETINNKEVQSVWREVATLVNDGKASTYKEAYEQGTLKLPQEYEGKLDLILEKMEELDMMERQIAMDQGVDFTPGSFIDYRSVNPEVAEASRKALIDDLATDTGLNTADIDPLVERIIHDETALDNNTLLDDLLDGEMEWDAPDPIKQRLKDQKKAIQDALMDEKYDKYMSQDLYYKQEQRQTGAAAKKMFDEYYGADGSGLIAMLKLAHSKGEITDDEYNYLAWEFRDAVRIQANTYQTVNPNWRKTQNHMMFMSTLAILPLATISSLVETGTLTTDLTPQQIHQNLMPMASNLATEFKGWINGGATKIRMTGRADYTQSNFAKALNKNIGFEDTAASARARAEATANLGGQQKILDGFFKAIFLQPWTSVMRMTAAGMAGDVIYGWIQNIAWDAKHNDGKETVLGRESKEMLYELGLDPEKLMYIYDRGLWHKLYGQLGEKKTFNPNQSEAQQTEAEMMEQIRFAVRQFVNGRVALPTKTNRPKLYYDQRFRMFMHFTGFISAFSSEILPKLYKNLVRGTPGLKYQAFATLMSMLFISFLAGLLKDELKYGEPSPWLKDWKLFQRTLYSSGLLGVGERAYNLIDPLYSQRNEGVIGGVINRALGEAPALDYFANIGESAMHGFEGDTAKAVRSGSKAIPLLGPFYQRRRDLGDLIADVFDGDL